MFDNIPNAMTLITLVIRFLCATNRKSAVTRSDWEASRALVIRVDQVLEANPGTKLTPYQRYVLDHGCACILARVEAATGKFDIAPNAKTLEAVEKAGARSARATRRRLTAPMVKF